MGSANEMTGLVIDLDAIVQATRKWQLTEEVLIEWKLWTGYKIEIKQISGALYFYHCKPSSMPATFKCKISIPFADDFDIMVCRI